MRIRAIHRNNTIKNREGNLPVFFLSQGIDFYLIKNRKTLKRGH